jgi:hypothetical protein
MTEHLQGKPLERDYPKQDNITSMTEAFFGFKPGMLSARKLSTDDQENKRGDERHREDSRVEETTEERRGIWRGRTGFMDVKEAGRRGGKARAAKL